MSSHFSTKGPHERRYGIATSNQPSLDPLKLLPGEWRAVGTGWNMIALPFEQAPTGRPKFRVLMNQYDETLVFKEIDDNVPNRGLSGIVDNSGQFDQFLVTLDYQQSIVQVAAEDYPASPHAGGHGLAIHHEPGLWLHLKNLRTNGIDIARLATIPHGNSVIALGESRIEPGMPIIPRITGLPIGRFEDFTTDDYFLPYKHFIDNPFFGNVPSGGGFPGFSPVDMNAILRFANRGIDIARTTTLTVDSTRESAGISNIPFVARQADAVSMKSTFWIQELEQRDKDGYPKLRLQYSQVVMLDFFRPRDDGLPGRAEWPHISIATLERVKRNEDIYSKDQMYGDDLL